MWTFEHTEMTSATPGQVWARYAEPSRWPEWDHETAEVTMRGPMRVGARGKLKPVKGPWIPFTFTAVTPEVGFTDVSRLPMARLTFTHHIAPTTAGSRITHRVNISGPLSPLFARLIGRPIAAGLPTAMQALARLAESIPAPPPCIQRDAGPASAPGARGSTSPGPGDSPGFLLWRATLRWQRIITAALRPLELTHVQFVLLASVWWLSDHRETGDQLPSQRQVADHAEVDVMMTSQVLRALEGRGLVTRTPDPSDARVKRLTVTDKGRRLATKAITIVDVADTGFFIRAHDRGQLLDVLHQLADGPHQPLTAGSSRTTASPMQGAHTGRAADQVRSQSPHSEMRE